MNSLDAQDAARLLDENTLLSEDIQYSKRNLDGHLRRYKKIFGRKEVRQNAHIFAKGKLTDLKRKTCEPIAIDAGIDRKRMQHFLGKSQWDYDAVLKKNRDRIVDEFADPSAVIAFDPSAFAKKGTHSCGVKRQWNGQLGKTDNCQVGVFASYVTDGGFMPLDARLYLPEDWANDPVRREETHVPDDVEYKKKWEMILDMLDDWRSDIPHSCIVADGEFGRCSAFRKKLVELGETYILDVPCNSML